MKYTQPIDIFNIFGELVFYFKKIAFLIIVVATSFSTQAQLYKASFIGTKTNEEFQFLKKIAYLDYNPKKKYVDLAFQDTLYHYKIKNSGKPKNKQRFPVFFKKCDDEMLWNISEQGNYLFVFKLNNTDYWFKKLSHPSREEYENFSKDLPKKSYK